ncbi:hypothetical protein [Luteimonas lutimaris]|uniref:Sel1 repeat family protein n=1 Tax=Luteimonas lutimaris TaxID=698645 RepID=A0ABP7MSU7_9GAMM
MTIRIRRLATLALIACAVAGLASWLWWTWPAASGASHPPAAGTLDAAGQAGTGADGIAATGGAVAVDDRTGAAPDARPLPSTDLPLRRTLDQLKREAAQGDPRAACRLAMELDHCNSLHESARVFERQASLRPQGMTQEDMRNHAALMERWADSLDRLSPRCDGVPLASSQERMRYWRAAALGGHVPAMTHYAIGIGFVRADTLKNLAALEAYRREAETMARRAAAAGDPLALFALIGAYMPDPVQYTDSPAMQHLTDVGFAGGSYLRQAVNQDLVETMALALLVRQAYARDGIPPPAQSQADIFAMQVDALDSVATPEQRLQAQQRMQQLRAEWTPIDPRESMLGPPLLPFFGLPTWDDDNLGICETGRRPPSPLP